MTRLCPGVKVEYKSSGCQRSYTIHPNAVSSLESVVTGNELSGKRVALGIIEMIDSDRLACHNRHNPQNLNKVCRMQKLGDSG
jgi:hypothetical protein